MIIADRIGVLLLVTVRTGNDVGVVANDVPVVTSQRRHAHLVRRVMLMLLLMRRR